MTTIGPLLQRLMRQLDDAGPAVTAALSADAHLDDHLARGCVPVIVQCRACRPLRGEPWADYKARTSRTLAPLRELLDAGENETLHLANAVASAIPMNRIAKLAGHKMVQMIELDPVVNPTLMDDAIHDVGVTTFRGGEASRDGRGVRVAVLDSGIDTRHPWLKVAESVTTCGEAIDLPGQHGTHCAGSIASRDATYPGVAPGVSLLNIKVLRQDGSGQHTYVAKGLDAALDLQAQVVSMSLGFNHLPPWSDGGHGWQCRDGRCPLCTAVDNATRFGAVVCVAAGNEHQRTEALRRQGRGREFDTELGCPGQARQAITVGALAKRTFLPAEFSSRGPSSYGIEKPDISAPGINIMSTVPVPRNSRGTPSREPARADLFRRFSGTSMATPIVAGAVALLIQQRAAAGRPLTPAAIRRALLTDAVTRMPWPVNVVGQGRVDLARVTVPR